MQEKGVSSDFEEVLRDIEYRDKNDSEREAAPLKQAEDAVLVDSSDMTAAEVMEQILSLVRREKN